MRTCNARKLICFGVAIVATLSVIGTGFCLWIFTDKTNNENSQLGIGVQAAGESVYGYFDENSLKNTGEYEEAEKGYIFPSSLVFDEGHGTVNKLDTGLNFYKRVNYRAGVHGSELVYVNQPYIADNVIVDFYEKDSSKLEHQNFGTKLCLTLEIIVTNQLARAIDVINKFPNINGKDYVDGQNLIYEIDYTELCNKPASNLNLPSHMSTLSNEKYTLHRFNLDCSNLFKYRNEQWKPTTTTGYKELLKLVDAVSIKGEQYRTTENISFNFKATYK